MIVSRSLNSDEGSSEDKCDVDRAACDVLSVVCASGIPPRTDVTSSGPARVWESV